MPSTLLLLLGTAAAYLTLAWFLQRSVTFPAPSTYARVPPSHAELVRLEQPAGTVEALYLAPAPAPSASAPLLVFFHGNGELVDYWVEPFQEVQSWGWGVLLVEYPGYGRSAGSPSEATIRAAALAAHDWARSDPRVDGTRIVAYGRSLAGAPPHGLPASGSWPDWSSNRVLPASAPWRAGPWCQASWCAIRSTTLPPSPDSGGRCWCCTDGTTR